MGVINPPPKVLPFFGMIHVDGFPVEELFSFLTAEHGAILKASAAMPFTHSHYYQPEMGPALARQWIAFEKLIDPDALVDLKHWTNELESKTLNQTGGRMVNIDPGIVTLSSVILASTKNYSHRIYLNRGIYAELTLIFKNNAFRTLEWTYPDYREETAINFFAEVRQYLKNTRGGRDV